MMKVELSKHLIKNIYESDLFSIGSFIYYKTKAKMCYKWIQLSYGQNKDNLAKFFLLEQKSDAVYIYFPSIFLNILVFEIYSIKKRYGWTRLGRVGPGWFIVLMVLKFSKLIYNIFFQRF